jgi:ankyrin repeat protein
MPFSANTIYFVANKKLKKELLKDPVLSYNLYWIKPGTLKNAKLPKKGLFAIRNVESPEFHDTAHIIPWDAVWSKKRQKIKFHIDEKRSDHPPARLLERIQELAKKYKTKAFYYTVQTHGGDYMQEYAWIFGEQHITLLQEDNGKKAAVYVNGKKVKMAGDVLYLALKAIGVKTKGKTGWFEPHTSQFIWRTIRLSPPINNAIKNPPFPTSLHRSLTLGDYDAVKNCLDNGIFPKNTDGLLEAASSSGNARLVKLMLDKKVPIKASWCGPLNLAKNAKTIDLLLKHGADLNHESNPLAHIAESGNKKAVKHLISKGAKLDLDKDKSLWFSACKGGILFLVKKLFPLVDIECEYICETGLTLAAENNRLNVVKWLYKNGAKVHQKALTEAASNGGLETVTWLLENTKIKIDAVNKYDRNALYEATRSGQLEMVNLLLEQGADPHKSMGSYDFSPIHNAAFAGSIPLLERFMQAGVSINTEANDKRTPLWIAVSFENQEMVDFLIDAGASQDLRGDFRRTFKEMAAAKNIILKAPPQSPEELEKITIENALIEKILKFLASIKISVVETELPDDTFLPGLRIMEGVILMDREKLKYPGDILHEAGHLAVTEEKTRPLIGLDKQELEWPTHGDELVAILWSFAACKRLKLPLEVVFHPNGYKDDSEWLIEQFNAKNYIGLPLLEWMGLCKASKFPKMKKWLR